MFAISQMDIVVDAQTRVIYIKPAEGRTNAPYYNYNRIGAVFEPQSGSGGDLIAHVCKDSPAYEAGVRDGDVLTKIGTADPRSVPLAQLWSQPAGTKINIECRRGEETLKFAITLKEIFPQVPPSKDASP
jgi:C-terminal processing protease CtpA/Prc